MLTAHGVTKRWSGRAVLDGVSLEVEPGTVLWVGGRNGTGKTTLLRIVAGLIAADEGEVRLDGLDPLRDHRAYHRRIGFLPAGNGGLYARLTVLDNLEFWAGVALIPRRRRAARVAAVVDQFELRPMADARVDRLSMGQRQRVRLAMTFLHEPTVVLLDEPHTSLDDDGVGRLDAAVERLVAGGGSALWCSPNRDAGAIPTDRALVLQQARLQPA